jgi:hypothetical protein
MVQRKFRKWRMFNQILKKRKPKNSWKNYPSGGRAMLAVRKRKCVIYTRALMMCWNKVKRPAVARENTGMSVLKYVSRSSDPSFLPHVIPPGPYIMAPFYL